MPPSIDIFCRVVDNYGDIGVCWRLARQLAARPDCGPIRLWVDDLASFARIAAGIRPDAATQALAGVQVLHWGLPGEGEPADIVIEAFACSPPAEYLARLTTKQMWINLEYLSAEDWVEDCHGLPSLQPQGLRKYFFFPGFTKRTGGLLREPGLLAQRDAWQADPNARNTLLQSLGVSPDWLQRLNKGATLVYVFCYPQAPLPALAQALSQQDQDALILLPKGMWPAELPAPIGGGNQVEIHPHDFVDQDRFDRLLWSCDLNIVRGEDSLTRAIWAGRPMIWQPYLQDDDIHLDKLQAWLAHSPYPEDIRLAMLAWSRGNEGLALDMLEPLLHAERLALWQALAHTWSGELAQEDDLATRLLNFCAKMGQTR